MTEELFEVSEDSQILTETALNERILEHPKFGRVRVCMPTLQIQRKIDAMSRAKKKMLLNAFDEIEDPDDPTKTLKFPAYQSREVMAKEYKEKGWWTDEHEQALEDLSARHVSHLAELEVLGFESAESCLDELNRVRESLLDIFSEADADSPEVVEAINTLTSVAGPYSLEAETVIRNEAPSTEVDDLTADVMRQKQIYERYLDLNQTYAELAALQNEQAALFSDSWQEQLKYYLRLAQVHYCVQNADTEEPLWPSLDAMEAETDSDLIRWVFDELSAFWQGLTEEMREKLGKYDFIYGRSGNKQSTEDSPALPESKADGESQESEQTSFTEDMDTTET